MTESAAIAKLEWDTPMYRLAVAQLDQTAKLMKLDENIVKENPRERLRKLREQLAANPVPPLPQD